MVYLTTPIYYVNDAPHVGHAYTTVIADALSRWHRLCGEPSRLVTGTDEHGLKVARAAAGAGVEPAALADATAPRFRAAWDRLGIGYDDFVRTTSQRHRAVAVELLQRVYDAGHVRLGRYQGRYCVGCEAYTAAAVCPVHRRDTEPVSEENWFFRLSTFDTALAGWFQRHPDAVRPAYRRNEALGWLRQGLVDFSISRASLRWGVPLPWDPGQVAYVWFDALGAYLTGIGWPGPESARWWPAHHVIGKDILRFHAIYWPAILLAAGVEPPARVTVHGFLLEGGEKIAKSGRRSTSLDELIELVGAEGLRYALLRDNPVGPDGDFTVASLRARYQSDLANTLGNLVSRVGTLVGSKCAGVAPEPDRDSPLSTVAAAVVEEAGLAWTAAQPHAALTATWRLVAAANAAVVAAQPWREAPGSPVAARVLGDALEALRIVAVLVSPVLPTSAQAIWARIGQAGAVADQRLPDAARWGGPSGRAAVTAGPPLFPRLAPLAVAASPAPVVAPPAAVVVPSAGPSLAGPSAAGRSAAGALLAGPPGRALVGPGGG